MFLSNAGFTLNQRTLNILRAYPQDKVVNVVQLEDVVQFVNDLQGLLESLEQRVQELASNMANLTITEPGPGGML